ncbi:MAG: succinate-semialdehyde dehydrogenase (NADP(+)), partial [Halieaceae bacterium]|nr:succinate-semialdehyde dehydrogenase (NADP(+)) [Halieaceae bacterium]
MTLTLSDSELLRKGSYIAGAWREQGVGVLAVANPANGNVIAEVATVDRAGTEAAIAAAHDAMTSWREVPAKVRAQVLRRWFDLMMAHQEDLAVIMTTEQGKTLAESRGEVAYGASFMEWFGEQAKRIDGDVIPAPSADKRVICIKQPIGVVAAITPWNFPNAMIARKAAPALAAGCTIVIKPASETPLSALAMAELAERAGVPAGVVNVVVGSSSEIGPALTDSPLVRKLTFTGSTEVGR